MSIEDLVNNSTRELSDMLTERRAFMTRVLQVLRDKEIPEPTHAHCRGNSGSSDTTQIEAQWVLTISEDTKPNHEYTVSATLTRTSIDGIAIKTIQASGQSDFQLHMQEGTATVTVPMLKSLLKIIYESRGKKAEPLPPPPTKAVESSLDL